jgi:putative holliday junction resolvase
VKILGIDYGSKRIGLAISDETQTLARELAIVPPKEFWQQVGNIVEQEGIERVIVGLPLNLSGKPTDKTREVQGFSDQLQQLLVVPIEFMDERLSSAMAEHLPGGRQNTDSLAAQIILQNYLDKIKSK